jgi:hypothetical protein
MTGAARTDLPFEALGCAHPVIVILNRFRFFVFSYFLLFSSFFLIFDSSKSLAAGKGCYVAVREPDQTRGDGACDPSGGEPDLAPGAAQ